MIQTDTLAGRQASQRQSTGNPTMPGNNFQPRRGALAAARKQRGWSQEELADRTECSVRRVRDAEAGKQISPMLLRRLAEAVGVSYELLLSGEERPCALHTLLPPRPLMIVGREREFAALVKRFQADLRENKCSIQAIAAVRGWPGVGKTTIAAELFHRPEIKAMFPDGGLWATVGRTPDLPRLLGQWARALGDISFESVVDPEELSRRIAGHLQHRRMLLVVDDVWETLHARLFQVGGPRCGMLLTTRLPLVAESLTPSPAHRYHIDVLNEEDALQLLGRLAPSLVESAPEACRSLVQEVEGLPLAVVIAGHLLESQWRRGLSAASKRALVERLLLDIRSGAKAILEALAPADMADLVSQTTPSVAALLRKSTEYLDDVTRDRFAYLGSFAPKPAVLRLRDMAAIWNVSEANAHQTAAQLIDCGLLEPIAEQRYWMHALIASLADSLCTE